MSDDATEPCQLRVADLPQHRPTAFHLRPGAAERARIAADLGILGVRKLDFKGQVETRGRTDWQLTAQLGATVEQSCVVTLEPVTTRIEQKLSRLFVRDLQEDLAEEIEMPEDDNRESLGAEIDLTAVLTEALALALPDYPRLPDATLKQREFAAPGTAPMTDADVKPFAGLAGLKAKLEKGD